MKDSKQLTQRFLRWDQYKLFRVWNASLILKELRELLGQSIGTVGDSRMRKTKDTFCVGPTQKVWGYQRPTMAPHGLKCRSAGGRHTHAYRKPRSGDLSGDILRHPFLTENTECTAMLTASLTLVIHYVLVFTRTLAIFLFNKFFPGSHSCFYKTQGNEQIL